VAVLLWCGLAVHHRCMLAVTLWCSLSRLTTLPRMAPQVTLLVYTNELNPEQARAILRGRLRAEYEMGRVSARHTALGRKHGDD